MHLFEKIFRRNGEHVPQNAVRALEHAPLVNQSKMLALAVALDLKPMSMISSTVFKFRSESLVGGSVEITSVMQALGLKCAPSPFMDLDGKEVVSCSEFIVSKSQERIDLFQRDMTECFRRGLYDAHYHEVFGRAMGFPETSIYAWNHNETLTNEEHDEFLEPEEREFLFFRLSRQYWKEEMRYIHQLMAGVRKTSPRIYLDAVQG